jgi:hypothetical protein
MFSRRRGSSKQNAASPPEPNSEHAAYRASMQHRMRPHYLSGDVCTLFSVAADAFLHMTNDEHDVGAYWKELNCWHTFVLSPSGPQGIPLRGGDCVWLVGTSGKCVDATPGTDGEAEHLVPHPHCYTTVAVLTMAALTI